MHITGKEMPVTLLSNINGVFPPRLVFQDYATMNLSIPDRGERYSKF